MAVHNPGRIAVIEMHSRPYYTINNGADTIWLPLYLAEARYRWFTYPPPYPQGQDWLYVTPWIWTDGDPHCYNPRPFSWLPWDTLLAERMNVPSPFTVTMWGTYNAGSGTGTISAQFRNDSSAALTGRVLFIITEDSINYVGPNGDEWHNQVARDYMPDTIGSLHTIPAGESLTVSQPFALDPSWNTAKIRFTTFIQDTLMQPDSVKEIWQGGMIYLDELGVMEYGGADVAGIGIAAAPNPCVSNTRFTFTLRSDERYVITVFDVTGRKIKVIDGVASGIEESLSWDLRDANGVRVSSGVYLYRFESDQAKTTGKVVVK